jgi:hypothetical protein
MLISDYLSSNTYNNLHSFFDLTYFRGVGQKYRNIFVRFLVQMKTSKGHSEINRPLVLPHARSVGSLPCLLPKYGRTPANLAV